MEPLMVAAGAIAKLAFDEFVKAGAGEAAKKSLGGAIELVKDLRGKIRAKLAGNDRAVVALAAVEQQGSEAALQKLGKYLDVEMEEDPTFASEIQQLAQQIVNIQNQTIGDTRIYNNYGRDQINIDKIEGNPNIGG